MSDPVHARTARVHRAFWLLAAGCVAGTALYVGWRVNDARPVNAPAAVNGDAAWRSAVDGLQSGPRFYFTGMRHDAFMRIEVAALATPEESILTSVRCDRIHMARTRGVCLAENRDGLQPVATASIVDARLTTFATLPLVGLPIRARMSSDERYAVATVFVTGENYDSDFTTRTTLIDVRAGTAIADLERFETERDGKAFRAVDFNFWGVTFRQDSNRFFATLGTGGHRFLVEGDIARRHLTVVRENVECPSLSPDEKRLVFKRRLPSPLGWQLHALDLATGAEWPITSEDVSVDDQAEWLDNEHVVYSIYEQRGEPEIAMKVWISSTEPGRSQETRIFRRAAWSPAVVR